MKVKNSYFKRIIKPKNKNWQKPIKIYSIFIFLIVIYISITKFKYEIISEYPQFLLDEYKNIFDLINKKKMYNLFRNKNKIENIFILISIFPFFKKEIILTKKNPLYNLYKKILNIKNNKVIKIYKNNKTDFSLKFQDLLYYKWEDLPNKNKTNYIRHILYHYYPEECLYIYEKSLNLNIKYYIENNREKISYEFITDLMSKI